MRLWIRYWVRSWCVTDFFSNFSRSRLPGECLEVSDEVTLELLSFWQALALGHRALCSDNEVLQAVLKDAQIGSFLPPGFQLGLLGHC